MATGGDFLLNGSLASNKQKEIDFSGFLTHAKLIDSKYFVSNKGMQLGDEKGKAQKIYGIPTVTNRLDGIDKLEWNFVGDQTYDGKIDLEGKPLVKDSFGYQVTMYFRNNELIGMILHNHIS